MLQAALAAGTADRRAVFELFPRRLPEGRRYGVVAGVGRALDAIEAFRFDRRRPRGAARRRRRRRADTGVAGRLPVLRRRLGVRRGGGLPALLAARRGRVELRRGGAARDGAALDLQPRQCDRLGGLPDDVRRGRAAVHRDGLAAYARGGGGGLRPGGVRRGLRVVVQPRRPAAVRRTHRRDVGAHSLHAAPRHGGRRLPCAGRLAGPRHDAAGRHLRRDRGRPARGRGRRPRARRGPPRLRRPGRARPPGPRAARRPRRDEAPGSWSPATSTSTRSPRWPPRRSTATASAPSW